MLKRMLVMIAVLSAVFVVARAQDTATEESAPEREIYTALGYGDGVFEPDIWYASASEQPSHTQATWRADGIGGLAYLDYIHFDEGVAFSQLDAVFNDGWFNATLSNYSVWRENTRCDLGELRLIEFSLQTNSIKYNMRYWIEIVDDHRVLTMFVVFPAADEDNLNTYSESLFPELSSCSGAVG
ncbi:MAG: hypothetical protein ABI690_26385 [Chloroflexota bacterium]